MKISSYLNLFYIFLITIVFLLFSTMFYRYFPSLSYFRPNLLLMLVTYVSIYRRFFEGILIAFVIGLVDSIHSPVFIGGSVFCYTAIFVILNFFSKQFYLRNTKLLIIVIISVVLSEKLIFLLLLHVYRDVDIIGQYTLLRIFFEIPTLLILSFPIFKLLRIIDHLTGVKEEKADFFSGPIYLRRV